MGVEAMLQAAQHLEPRTMLALHQWSQTHAHAVTVFHRAMQILAELEQYHLYRGECCRVGA